MKWLSLIVSFAFQHDDSQIATCVHKDHGDFITADPALGADQLLDAQLLGEGIPGLRVLFPSYTGMSSTAGGPLAFYRV